MYVCCVNLFLMSFHPFLCVFIIKVLWCRVKYPFPSSTTVLIHRHFLFRTQIMLLLTYLFFLGVRSLLYLIFPSIYFLFSCDNFPLSCYISGTGVFGYPRCCVFDSCNTMSQGSAHYPSLCFLGLLTTLTLFW